ncbi:hypothetical protein HBI56_224970 [Parastagonospora nodorum]|uniref:Uncharacterized protein n=1 Tax=Phaeosphaeria nodorum (strain SN15 / ATCC MYA-4574 / FGSC 10173) TaxID=321614 RepID=A0A7U2ID45_PHANO|nr:hypothetical protein HBH56_093250 [Parastagonospora nodorum]QRD07642.1 hypothetical protein JI435_163260 [Parastagonospora nodorum SN15]KAH3921585.1 hypothetical protein HBH54_237420 [Parastagonospora nodorum]KAH3939734.1 hypothetical protein HBH53_229360 [Parastagonospora nodorum]KAH3957954.1 hypothetical protein HBH51_217890 [Parastagonospora nodorum]
MFEPPVVVARAIVHAGRHLRPFRSHRPRDSICREGRVVWWPFSSRSAGLFIVVVNNDVFSDNSSAAVVFLRSVGCKRFACTAAMRSRTIKAR